LNYPSTYCKVLAGPEDPACSIDTINKEIRIEHHIKEFNPRDGPIKLTYDMVNSNVAVNPTG